MQRTLGHPSTPFLSTVFRCVALFGLLWIFNVQNCIPFFKCLPCLFRFLSTPKLDNIFFGQAIEEYIFLYSIGWNEKWCNSYGKNLVISNKTLHAFNLCLWPNRSTSGNLFEVIFLMTWKHKHTNFVYASLYLYLYLFMCVNHIELRPHIWGKAMLYC